MNLCFFDIDGTMLLTGGAGQAAMEAALADEFGNGKPVEGISYAGRTDRGIINDFFLFHGVEPTEERITRFIQVYLEHLPNTLAELRGTVLPGIAEALLELSGMEHVLLGLLTGNMRDGAMLKLRHYELDAYFPFGGFGDRHLERDDVARDALVDAGRFHGNEIEPGRVWVVGDTPADVRCGRAIGANVVAVATGSYTADELQRELPDYLFEDFSDPSTLLGLLSD